MAFGNFYEDTLALIRREEEERKAAAEADAAARDMPLDAQVF